MIGDAATFNKSIHKAIGNINGVSNIMHLPPIRNIGIGEPFPKQVQYTIYPYQYVGEKNTKYFHNMNSNGFILQIF